MSGDDNNANIKTNHNKNISDCWETYFTYPFTFRNEARDSSN